MLLVLAKRWFSMWTHLANSFLWPFTPHLPIFDELIVHFRRIRQIKSPSLKKVSEGGRGGEGARKEESVPAFVFMQSFKSWISKTRPRSSSESVFDWSVKGNFLPLNFVLFGFFFFSDSLFPWPWLQRVDCAPQFHVDSRMLCLGRREPQRNGPVHRSHGKQWLYQKPHHNVDDIGGTRENVGLRRKWACLSFSCRQRMQNQQFKATKLIVWDKRIQIWICSVGLHFADKYGKLLFVSDINENSYLIVISYFQK